MGDMSWLVFGAGALVGIVAAGIACASLAQLDARWRDDEIRRRTEQLGHLLRERAGLVKARWRARELELRIRCAQEFSQQAKPADLLLAEVMHALVDADQAELREWRRDLARRAEAPADVHEVADA